MRCGITVRCNCLLAGWHIVVEGLSARFDCEFTTVISEESKRYPRLLVGHEGLANERALLYACSSYPLLRLVAAPQARCIGDCACAPIATNLQRYTHCQFHLACSHSERCHPAAFLGYCHPKCGIRKRSCCRHSLRSRQRRRTAPALEASCSASNVQFSGGTLTCHERRERTMATPRSRRAHDAAWPFAATAG